MPKAKESGDKSRIRIGKKVIDLDLDSLTIGETEELELELGAALPQIQALLETGSVRAIKWVAYVIYRRNHPTASIESFNGVKIVDIGDAENSVGKEGEPASDGDPST